MEEEEDDGDGVCVGVGWVYDAVFVAVAVVVAEGCMCVEAVERNDSGPFSTSFPDPCLSPCVAAVPTTGTRAG